MARLYRARPSFVPYLSLIVSLIVEKVFDDEIGMAQNIAVLLYLGNKYN